MFKFLKKTSKKLIWTAFGVWKDRKIQKAKEAVASKLDAMVDHLASRFKFWVFGTTAIAGCAGGPFVLLPLAYCLNVIAENLAEVENASLAHALNKGAFVLYVAGVAMTVALVAVVVVAAFWAKARKKKLKSKINELFRD